jgi:flagellar basal body-associated protein FliL
MAENQSVEEALGQPTPAAAPKGKFVFLGIVAGILVLSSAAGFSVGKAIRSQNAPKEEAEAAKPDLAKPVSNDEMSYYDFDPIIVTLNEQRMDRFIRSSITLAVKTQDLKSGTLEMLEKRKPEIKSWLNIYLAGCSLDQVRGDKNLNRLRREIQDLLNQKLFGDSKPLIDDVLFREFAVQ